MRDYGKVSPKFWIGPTGKVLRQCGHEAQLVGLYLMTSPHANMLGLYYLPKAFIAHETGLGLEGACKGLARCIEGGFCMYDEDSEMVWVLEMARYQVADSLKDKDLRIKGVQNEYDSLPENPYLSAFYDMYGVAFCMSSKRGKASPPKAPSKPLASQEQEQEQEQDQENKPKPTSSSGDDGARMEAKPFDQFWEAYPRKVGKQDAQKAWIKLKLDDSLQTLLDAIAEQQDGADWRRDGGEYIPHPATWLRGGRWLDEVRPYVAPPLKLPAGWWETHEGMKAAGLMLTPPLKPNQGEYPKEFAQRIRAALGHIDQIASAAPSAPSAAPAPYVPPTVPEGVQLTTEQLEARKQEMREALKTMSEKAGNARAGVTTPTAVPA